MQSAAGTVIRADINSFEAQTRNERRPLIQFFVNSFSRVKLVEGVILHRAIVVMKYDFPFHEFLMI